MLTFPLNHSMEGIHRGPVACLAAGPAMQTLHRDPSSILALLTERCWDIKKKNCPILQVYIYIYIHAYIIPNTHTYIYNHPEVDRAWDVLKDISVLVFCLKFPYSIYSYITHTYIYTLYISYTKKRM